MAEQKKSIPDFYRDRSVFITGSTGFVGKGLVEKLLRSCAGIKTVYLLLRHKEGQDAKQRLEDLLQDKLFERVKNKHPDALSKLVLIQGDLSIAGLGISTSDLNLLVDNVSVVLNVAATIKLKGPLKKSLTINTIGTRRIIELCHKLEKLEALIHVSTAYCNCDRATIEEVVYDLPVSPSNLIDTIEGMDEGLVDVLTPHLIRGRPNTYTYTKALAESLCLEVSDTLPVAIVRPSIVTAAWKEPFPGWINDYNGLTGIFASFGKGLLRSLLMKSSATADLIPVDIVVNLIIAAAWFTATHRPQEFKVYNCTSGSINGIKWGSVIRQMVASSLRYPSRKIFRYPNSDFITDSKVKDFVSVMLDHHIPACFFDLVSVMTGRKPKYIPTYKKLHTFLDAVVYFSMREWTFSCDNVLMLQEKLTAEDTKDFNFNIKTLDWPIYIENYVLGIRQFLFNEEESSLPEARKNLKRLFIYSRLTKCAILIMLLTAVLIVYNGDAWIWTMFI